MSSQPSTLRERKVTDGSESADPAFAAFCAAGLWPGLGHDLRARLADAGIDRPAAVSETALAGLTGVSTRRAATLAVAFDRARPLYDVVALLVTADLPARLAASAVGVLGPGAAGQLADDPWRLLDAGEADLAAADRLAAARGRDRRDPYRGPSVLVHLLALAARTGDTAVEEDRLYEAARSRGVGDPEEALRQALDAARIHAEHQDECVLLALPRYAMAEQSLAEGLARLTATADPIGEPDALGVSSVAAGLDETQRAAVATAMTAGVSLLTGGPGTGKSRTVAAVVEVAKARGARIAIAAPTGRAAKRLEEVTGQPAATLHRLLGARASNRASAGEPRSSATVTTFARGESWPLDADLVVVDEASMLDVELAAALVEACSDGAHLLLVGDPAQLPSIGPGRVLGDLVDSGLVPVTELTRLYRQAEGGTIARLATAVREGRLPTGQEVHDEEREVVIAAAADAEQAARRVVQLVTDSIPRALGIPATDVQVLTPIHAGPAGTEALNVQLKAALDPGERRAAGARRGPRFDVGDRVVAVANHLDDGFANGDVGVVTGRTSDGLQVAFAAGPVVVSPAAQRDLRLGWAITVHRGQGSEWPAVVVALPPEASGILSRPLVYTAFTRAQRHLSVVPAVGAALERAVRVGGGRPRRTALPGRLAEEFADAIRGVREPKIDWEPARVPG